MKITLRQPLGYSHIGRKDQQEDAVWPLFEDVTSDNHCIVLCDGVGGSEHGEIASQTSSKVIGEYLTKLLKEKNSISEYEMQEAVDRAYDEMERIEDGMERTGRVSMATTMTCVCLHSKGILAAHMGDSRIYHVRPGHGVMYQSDDHSWVSEMLKSGELTPEQAKTFPLRNVITRAIQPHSRSRMDAECHQLTDVKGGDYLFLCSDGVLEQLTNKRLVEVLSMDCTDEEKLRLLESESLDKTRDNFTAYLIPVENIRRESTIKYDGETAIIIEDPIQ